MSLRLLDIDFEKHTVRLCLDVGKVNDVLARLDDVVALCRSQGLAHVEIVTGPHPNKLPRSLATALSRHDATVAERQTGRSGRLHESKNYVWVDHPDGLGSFQSGAVYHMRFEVTDESNQQMTTAVILAGAIEELEEKALTKIRFVSYELTVNTAEHGKTVADTHNIEAQLFVSGELSTLEYRDNTALFETIGHNEIDVAEKIANHQKRGLGLYMLNKLGTVINYERRGNWNVTSFSMLRTNNVNRESNKEKRMDTITVNTIPCKLTDTVVLRPIGSIDSNTAHIVENHLDLAIEQGNVRVVIDFSEVDFVSSAGVGIFLGTVSRLRGLGGDLVFMSLPEHIEEVFDIINLKSFFKIIDGIEQLPEVEKV